MGVFLCRLFHNSYKISNMSHEDSSASFILADERRSEFLKLVSGSDVCANNSANDEDKTKNEQKKLFLNPKKAFEVLNELRPHAIIQIKVVNNNVEAIILVDNMVFYGKGCSKVLAVESAAEKALQHIFFPVILKTATSRNDTDLCQYNTEPWKNLASFAIFKLMNEWLSVYRTNNPYKQELEKLFNNVLKVEKYPKNFVGNASSAVDLLNKISKQNMSFKDFFFLNDSFKPYKSVLTINNIEYEGDPSVTKKNARQSVAKKVLLEAYGIKL